MFAIHSKVNHILTALVGVLVSLGFLQVLAAAPDPIMVADINPSPIIGSSPIFLTPLDDKLLFIADDGSLGAELWKHDSTGTSLVKDIAPGADPLVPNNLKVYNGLVYFTGNDSSGTGEELWVSDGTETGTVMLKDINPIGNSNPTRFTISNGLLFFQATDGVHGFELWKSDGTPAGTVMVKDINPDGSSSPTIMTDVNGTLFFVAIDDTHGEELWKSDGTVDGTVLVKDIIPGVDDVEEIRQLQSVGDTLFFRANDPVSGKELWKSDGSEAGTIMVKDIFPGADGSSPTELVDLNGVLYFSANDGLHGAELWKSDGTATGTEMVMDITPGTDSSNPSSLTVAGDLLYFGAFYPSIGREPWKSDGTLAGTKLIKDIHVSGSSTPLQFTNIVGTVFFRATDESHGAEFWKTNGTEESTLLVKDINPGTLGSAPDQFILAQDRLFFVADDGEHGRELWALDLQNLPPTVDAGGPYFGVEGSPIAISGAAEDEDLVLVEWISIDPICVVTDPALLETSVVCSDNGEFELTLLVLDWWNESASDQTSVSASNVAPQIVSLSASADVVQVGQTVEILVLFNDAGQTDTHTANIEWELGLEAEMVVDQEAGSAVASHAYNDPGQYTIVLTVIDDDGASVEATIEISVQIFVQQGLIFLPLVER